MNDLQTSCEKKSSRHSYLKTQGAREGCHGTPEYDGFFFFFFSIGQWQQRDPGWGGPFEANLALCYRARGTGGREHLDLITEQRDRVLENSESGSEVPDSPTGAVVNLHISTQEGASQSCLSTIHMCQQ